ncbi:hypothetical protein Scep_007252 [Stephania cephalantha]|uniref:Uncharacterized protein n=1 Tax=Stephania cephalantha TaxID=152367 RepID=A0AAP0PNN3_9MAGN
MKANPTEKVNSIEVTPIISNSGMRYLVVLYVQFMMSTKGKHHTKLMESGCTQNN